MPDTPGKRQREAQKRRNREMKAERKRLRKEGILGQDTSGLFAPGEVHREIVGPVKPEQTPVEKGPEEENPAAAPEKGK